jgi:hypothetical protein
LRLPEFSRWEDLATTQILTLQKSKTHDGKRVTRSIKQVLSVAGLPVGIVGMGLKLQNIPDEVVILIKLRKIIVTASMNPYQRYFSWINFLQLFTVPDRNQ